MMLTHDQALILIVLASTGAMLLWGRWRHDMVALGALLVCVLAGLVPAAEAFSGFSHPAVITVACVLVLSYGLQTSGAVDALARYVLPAASGPTTTIAALTGLAACLSSFMNNVGALALLMPLAIQVAARQGLPAGRVLMPLAFGSILGGMTTLIGTPPNLIVSNFRVQSEGSGFAMFDFTPVGIVVALTGVAFVAIIGWRLVPARKRADVEGFETGAYLTEARVLKSGKAAGMSLRQIETELEGADAQIVGVVHNGLRVPAPGGAWRVWAGDVLIIEAEPGALASVLSSLGLILEEDARKQEKSQDEEQENGKGVNKGLLQSDDIVLIEMVVLPDAAVTGRSASSILLRSRYGVNLLAISRQGRRSTARLRTMPIHEGDVLLLQGAPEALAEFAAQFGCVPLAERPLRLPETRRTLAACGAMAVAVGCAAFDLLPAAVAFAVGALLAVGLRVIPLRRLYTVIDWPVIVLLAALIPVAGALADTGTADLIARFLLDSVAQGNVIAALAVILIVTMTLSDFMNNAATATIMCPIAIGTAERLSASADPFLMAVAVGASCAFLTPIGHQNNTLILGPGGFRFGDYWRLGLPLEVLVVAVGIPMIVVVWPL